ncbi:MAG: hypothetical protein CVV49_18070 [Spirochaetae bacterium HGW-Spirochaetae-5]|nr:MAG: hypothetical protein CVV49_18070 [Spirochaetae bacterium HGW-Spirochaetae-5]
MRGVRFLLIIFMTLHVYSSEAGELKKVSLQLRWDHQFQFAGYYAAKWKGYYADAGLDVEIRSAVTSDGKILSAVKEVASGNSDFGIGAADILIGIDRGDPLVLLATIFQQSAAEFYCRESTSLSSPVDFLKLKVARNVNDLIDVELQAMLLAEGIDPGRVFPYEHMAGIEHLIDGRVDVIPGYRLGAPYQFMIRKIKVKSLSPLSYGIDFYGDSIFTNARLVEVEADTVKKFRDASLKGWIYALEHSDEIAERIAAELPRNTVIAGVNLKEYNIFQTSRVKELAHYPFVNVGNINPSRWNKMNDLMKKSGVIRNDIDINKIIYDPERADLARSKERNQILLIVLVLMFGSFFITLAFVFVLRMKVNKATVEIRKREDALRETNDYLESLINYANAPIIVWDSQFKITRFNYAFEKITGRDSYDVIGESIEILFPESQIKSSMDHIRRTLAGERLETVEINIKHMDLSVRTLLWNSATLFSSDGNHPVATIAQGNDITERKLAEDKIKNLLTEKELLLKEVHHRIKNNMNTVKGLLTLQMSAEKNSEVIESLKSAESRVQSMIILYDRLYCSNEYSELSVKVYLESLVGKIVSIFPNSKIVRVEMNIEDFLLNIIMLSNVGIIINEIITNMMKYAFEGRDSGLIVIYVSRRVKTVSLAIKDDGIGIPESITFSNSTGFGMQLVGMLTEQLGGNIRIERADGTKFVIEFDV